MGLRHTTAKSFKYAFRGIRDAYNNEPNLRIHTYMGSAALIAGVILNLSPLEWIILLFTIFWVISLELLNTVLEAVVNLVSPDVQPYARIAKDVSAACVLLAAILSIIVGFILFVPKLILLMNQ